MGGGDFTQSVCLQGAQLCSHTSRKYIMEINISTSNSFLMRGNKSTWHGDGNVSSTEPRLVYSTRSGFILVVASDGENMKPDFNDQKDDADGVQMRC